jgi:hypothetical protein
MKILNEAKENLPISFLTDFISKGWEEVGYLKADIEAIKQSFKGTKKVEELIQSLVDAYLVCIGQLEAHIHDKNYIEYPEESGLGETKKETLEEDLNITVNTEKIEVKVEPEQVEEIEEIKVTKNPETKEKDIEEFEYFVDFDEPDLTQPKLTDDDLYNN